MCLVRLWVALLALCIGSFYAAPGDLVPKAMVSDSFLFAFSDSWIPSKSDHQAFRPLWRWGFLLAIGVHFRVPATTEPFSTSPDFELTPDTAFHWPLSAQSVCDAHNEHCFEACVWAIL